MSNDYHFELVTPFGAQNETISPKDFLERNPNEFYQGGDFAWMMISSVLVMMMVPGLGLFYSGIGERSSAMSMMLMSMLTVSVIALQWFLFGYSITFTGSNPVWGYVPGFALNEDLTAPWAGEPGPALPRLLHAFYQGMFACFTAAIVSGAVIRKGKPLHFLVFIFIWSTFVYDPIARASWNPIGWSNNWRGRASGVFDFAGGTVVHITSATTAAIYSMFFKWRRVIFGMPSITEREFRALNRPFEPSNIINVSLGTFLLWIGWFGFNGGSALGANMRAVSACISTHLAACTGGLTGTIIQLLINKHNDSGKFSMVAFCNGAIAGLVAITPAAGYVSYWSAPIFGLLGSFFVMLFEPLNAKIMDTNGICVIHGVAGFVGMMLTAAFAKADVAHLDGYTVIVNRHAEQLGIQLLDVVVAVLWSGLGTFLILLAMETVIFVYRKKWGQEPQFQVLDDTYLIVAQEIGVEALANINRDRDRDRERDIEMSNLAGHNGRPSELDTAAAVVASGGSGHV